MVEKTGLFVASLLLRSRRLFETDSSSRDLLSARTYHAAGGLHAPANLFPVHQDQWVRRDFVWDHQPSTLHHAEPDLDRSASRYPAIVHRIISRSFSLIAGDLSFQLHNTACIPPRPTHHWHHSGLGRPRRASLSEATFVSGRPMNRTEWSILASELSHTEPKLLDGDTKNTEFVTCLSTLSSSELTTDKITLRPTTRVARTSLGFTR